MTGRRRTWASPILRAASSTSSSTRATISPPLISSRTGVSGPLPLATPRTAMSRSVIIPIRRSPSTTGIDPASALSMKFAASCAVWSAPIVSTSRVITSLTFTGLLPLEESTLKTNGRSGPFLRLRHVLGQKVVGGDQLVPLVEDFDRPADDADVLALQRFRPDRELDPHRIARIERGQEAQVLKSRVGQHGTRIRIDEQAGGEAQDQIAVR